MNNYLIELNSEELFIIDGGKKSVSDYLLFAGGVCACFVHPALGVTICTAVFLWT